MNEDRLDVRLTELVESYRRPPVTPREEMWSAIQAERSRQRGRRVAGRVWLPAGLGMAATFLLGMLVGSESPRPTEEAGSPAVSAQLVDLETGRHLARVDVLLRAVRAEAAAGSIGLGRADDARVLLAENRLLTDLPPGEHLPEVAALLTDIELVLAQISVMEKSDPDELRLVEEGIEAREVLPRLFLFALNL